MINVTLALEPINRTTLSLQKEQLFYADFYKLWLNLKLELQQLRNPLATKLAKHIEHREKNFLNNDSMVAALYLDPRLKRILSKDQKETAVKHLKKVAFKMLSAKQDVSIIFVSL